MLHLERPEPVVRADVEAALPGQGAREWDLGQRRAGVVLAEREDAGRELDRVVPGEGRRVGGAAVHLLTQYAKFR